MTRKRQTPLSAEPGAAAAARVCSRCSGEVDALRDSAGPHLRTKASKLGWPWAVALLLLTPPTLGTAATPAIGTEIPGVTAAGASKARALAERFGELANVRDFGAKGDWAEPAGSGATDDTVAFQAAIDSGKPVYVPPGIYRIAGTLRLPVTPAAIRIFGENQRRDGTGRRGTTHLHMEAASGFRPMVPGTYSNPSTVSLQMSGLSIESSTGKTVLFDSMQLGASEIHSCVFQNFSTVIYGTLIGVSTFHHNVVAGCKRGLLVMPTTFDRTNLAPLVDSVISDNYINGDPAAQDCTLLDLRGASASSVANNYLDFAYRGIWLGEGNGLVTVQNNTFDILYRAIEVGYGSRDISIIGNRFFNIRRSSASHFKKPAVELTMTDWNGILLTRYATGVSVVGNAIRNSERFMVMPGKWYRDIKELGNVSSTLGVPLVHMSGRSVDEKGFVTAGGHGDGSGFQLESMHLQRRTTLPDPVTESFDGHVFWLGAVLVTNRGGRFFDVNGLELQRKAPSGGG